MPLPIPDLDYLKITLDALLAIPSPVGRTQEATEWCRQTICEWAPAEVRISRKGVLSATFAGEKADEPRGITAHLDTLGAVVKTINPNGRFHLFQLGNYSWNSLENEAVRVFAQNGRTYYGSILVANSSHHLHQGEHGNAGVPRNENTIEVRLDACANSYKEVSELGIEVGDFVAFEPRTTWSEGAAPCCWAGEGVARKRYGGKLDP